MNLCSGPTTHHLFVLQVTVNNEDSDDSFESSWSYMQNIQSSALWGNDRRKFLKAVYESQVRFTLPFQLLHLFTSQPVDTGGCLH